MDKILIIVGAIIIFVILVIFVLVYWWKYQYYTVTLSGSTEGVLPNSMVDDYIHTFVWESTIFTPGPVGYMYEKAIVSGAKEQLALLIMYNTKNFMGVVVPYAAGAPVVPVPVASLCAKYAILGGIINFGSQTDAAMIAAINIYPETTISNTAGEALLLGAQLPASKN
jgi:hypothetical protein